MANSKISALPVVTAVNTAALVPIVQSGVTSQVTASNFSIETIRRADHVITTVATTQTLNLSTTATINVLVVSSPGLTITVQFPTAPLEGQIVEFTTLTNTVTLIVGTGGTFSVNPSFAGAPVAGFSATYVYHDSDDTYYKIAGT